MVTHDTLSARETDRLYILQKGKVLQEQTKALNSKKEQKEVSQK